MVIYNQRWSTGDRFGRYMPPIPKVVGRSRYGLQGGTWSHLPTTTYSDDDEIVIDDDEEMEMIEDYVQPFRFLELPPELRNRVYTFIFLPNTSGSIYSLEPSTLRVVNPSLEHTSDDIREDSRNVFSILETCRQVYTEAAEIPYINNYLKFLRTDDFAIFIGHASERLLHLVRNVEMELNTRDKEVHYWGMLRFLPNLAKLRVALRQPSCVYLLAEPNDASALKIKALRWLKEMEVIVLTTTGEGQGTFDNDAAKLVEILAPVPT